MTPLPDVAVPKLRGVTFIAVLMWLTVAVCFLGMVAALLLGLGSKPPRSPALVADKYHLACIGAYLAVAAGVLAVGLKRRRSWAWDGTVVWAALVVLMFQILSLCSFSIVRTKPFVAAVFLVLCLMGTLPAVAILLYLFRTKTRQGFSAQWSATTGQPSVWIRLIAAHSILLSGVMLCGALSATPHHFFGLAPRGYFQALYAVVSASIQLYVGFGLYGLGELARRCAIGYTAFTAASSLYWMCTAPLSRPGFIYLRIGAGAEVTIVSLAIALYLIARHRDFCCL